MKKRTVALLMAAVLLFGAAVGGTLAWLQDSTDPIVNTFTAGHVRITLTETKPEEGTAKMVPGTEIAKDPTIAVVAQSEECYLYVKVVKTALLDTYISYTMAAGWTEMDTSDDGLTTVYYREVDKDTAAAGVSYPVLLDNQVTVNDVSSTQMEAVTADNVKLTFTGYAVQKEAGQTAQTAWTAAGF